MKGKRGLLAAVAAGLPWITARDPSAFVGALWSSGLPGREASQLGSTAPLQPAEVHHLQGLLAKGGGAQWSAWSRNDPVLSRFGAPDRLRCAALTAGCVVQAEPSAAAQQTRKEVIARTNAAASVARAVEQTSGIALHQSVVDGHGSEAGAVLLTLRAALEPLRVVRPREHKSASKRSACFLL